MSRMNELSQVLDELTACGEGMIRAAKALREMYSTPAEEIRKEPEDEEPVPVKEEPAKETAKAVTLVDVRRVLAAKSHDGFTEQVKALLAKYGAGKLSELSESNYAEILADAEALK